MGLMDRLPARLYGGEEHVADLQGAFERQVRRAQAARDDLLLQCRPSTATWGLERCEREYGIPPDASKTLEERRAVWRAKRRGRGTTTAEMVRSVAQSFSGLPVTVAEHPERYRFDLRFSALDAGNLAGLREAMDEIKPAHLVCNTILRLEAGQNAPVRVGARLSGATRLTVWPYLAPDVTANTQIPVAAYAAVGNQIKVGG